MSLSIYQSHGLAKLKEQAFRDIVRRGQMSVLDDARVDTFSASAVLAVINAVKPETKERLLSLPIHSIVSKCFTALKRART